MNVSRLTLRVDAIGTTDAQDIAKRRARDDGWKVRTVASVRPAAGFDGNRTIRGPWVVELAVVRP